MDDMGLCSYCKKVHDNRVACPEYMFAQLAIPYRKCFYFEEGGNCGDTLSHAIDGLAGEPVQKYCASVQVKNCLYKRGYHDMRNLRVKEMSLPNTEYVIWDKDKEEFLYGHKAKTD